MKIGMVTHEYPPNIRGGCGISCELLVRNLRKKGIYVDVFVFDKERSTIYSEMGNTYYFEIMSNLPHILNLTTLLKLKIPKKKYDLIHVYGVTQIPVLKILQVFHHTPVVATLNGFEEACFDYSTWMSKKCKTCTVIENYHCIYNMNNKLNRPKILVPFKFLYFNIQRYFSKRIDDYIALSDSMKEIYISAGFPEDKITVIPNMIDPNFIQLVNNSKTEKYSESNGRNVVLYIGNLNKTKGVDTLINSFSKISKNNVELWIVGTGIHEKQFKDMADKSPMRENIKFFGFVEYKKLPDFYKAADVFVHPGIWPEPFGRTILEAMICKLPVITSNVGAPPKIVGDSGLIYEIGDLDALTQWLEQILSDEEQRIRLAKSSFEKVISKYSFENIVNEIIISYKTISGGRYK